MILVQIFYDEAIETPTYPNPTVVSFARGFGSILFSFGGAATFPTIQNDMADRSKFWRSVIIGFSGAYMCVCVCTCVYVCVYVCVCVCCVCVLVYIHQSLFLILYTFLSHVYYFMIN